MKCHDASGCLALVCLAAAAVAPSWAESSDTDSARLQRVAWFAEARFGMFIHWGPFSVQGNDPQAKYDYFAMKDDAEARRDFERYAEAFRPGRFDAAQWMETARDAGARYVVFTSKHHDGYCMFDSALSDFTTMKGAPKRDYVRDLIAAARVSGLKIGFYYSMLDWKHPDYTGDLARFVEEYLFGQVRELCTNYGPIDCFWFDGEWDHPLAAWRSPELVNMIRALQPNALINDRLGKGERGVTPLCDFYTREQSSEVNVPMAFEHEEPRPWEACMTIGDFWQFSLNDTRFKSVDELVGVLVDVASRGGNLLLNVGPDPDGQIPRPLVERLRGVGAWLAVNGESVYGTTRSPFGPLPVGKCTAKANRLYLHVDSSAGSPVQFPRLQNTIRKAFLLSSNAALPFDNGAKTVTLPKDFSQGSWRVAVIELDTPPVVH
ncbi:MAG TPA: alpha-L-fucosidase [Candidatus Hydrogenedentes bacterium]|nr:alpha-L-fucosidase [Candidatus Hydrogenedentota bacterium]HPG66159.1 alpha-L-fucosidase [Candidatus Hydrogenedentota bacterium]